MSVTAKLKGAYNLIRDSLAGEERSYEDPAVKLPPGAIMLDATMMLKSSGKTRRLTAVEVIDGVRRVVVLEQVASGNFVETTIIHEYDEETESALSQPDRVHDGP